MIKLDKFVIDGPAKLSGTVTVDGSKNASLPILAACLLSDEKSVTKGIPVLSDVTTMIKIMRSLGVKIDFSDNVATVEPAGYKGHTALYEYVSTMRASVCVLGPLLAKHKCAKVSHPGGCVIGPRPIDLHIKGIRALNADAKVEHGYLLAKTKGLRGSKVYLGGAFGSSVLATANVMMAATLARGTTVIQHAACEPEVVDLAEFLIKMGAKIKGHGSHTIQIDGVKKLHGATHTVIPDRIETGTYIVAACATDSDIIIKNGNLNHLGAMVDKLIEAGALITGKPNGDIRVRLGRSIKPVDLTTLPYPGFPTDLQAQMMALLSTVKGISIITEKIYPDRFIHVGELNRMGAQISLEGESAIVKGVESLSGAEVMASDLRASAALIVSGMMAEGQTKVSRIYHLDRGYKDMEGKLTKLGVKVKRIRE